MTSTKHLQFGKMAEATQHWNTARHPAFKKIRVPPNKGNKSTNDLFNSILANETLLNDPSLWVVTEKVHGSNMSFVVFPSGEVKCAKREEFLTPEDNDTFFGFMKVKKQLDGAAQKAFPEVIKMLSTNEELSSQTVTRLTIYGELFGGTFPNLQSPSDVKMPVQDG